MTHVPLNPADTTYRGIIRLAAPLILTMSGFMLMNFVDALMLSWYSADAIAAVVPSAMAYYLFAVIFTGTVGYVSVLVSQYVGAGRPERVAPVVWQGIYVALVSGGLVTLVSALGAPLFAWVGHAPAIQELEVVYFQILCWGALPAVLIHAISGFFSGRRITIPILIAQSAAFAVNAALDWLLIFGRWGAPRMGVAGAAWATVAGQAVACVVLVAMMFSRGNRLTFGTWSRRGLDAPLVSKLIRYGIPNASRYVVEVMAWTAFVFFIGRIGQVELAATNIAWRINGLAFFPVIGLSMAVGILVGNAQGERRPDMSVLVTRRGLAISQGWMMSAAVVFVLFPRFLYGLFDGGDDPLTGAQITAMGIVLLRFVALYSLIDGFNIVILSTLQSAGDTRWTFIVSLALHAVFLAALILADLYWRSVMTEWTIATTFVIAQAFVWLARFRSGGWRNIVVVEMR